MDHKGKGSYEKVKDAAILIKNKLGSLDPICVIDVNSKPKDVYENLKSLQSDYVNMLLTDFTYQTFPYTKNENNFYYAN